MQSDPTQIPTLSFRIRPRLLMGPGPSNVHPRVLAAMAQPVLGHLDPQFAEIMNQTQVLLRRVFETENRMTYPVSATGSGGMEAALVNLLEPGDEAIVGVIGYFGNRMHEIATRTGATVHRYDKPWGDVFAVDEIAAALDRHPRARVLALVHGETSTGMLQPLEEIGRLSRSQDRLLLVDAVATLGGIELPIDAWHIDVCYSGSQKCLSGPPGLAPITFGERALEHMSQRRTKVQSWYFDAVALSAYWTAGEGRRAYHHTAPVSMVYALREALALVDEEGLPARFARHRAHSGALLAGLGALGFQPLGRDGFRMPIVNAVRLPEGFEDAPNRKTLLEEHGIEVAAGLGDLAGKAWRVGLMGESASRHHVLTLLAALDSLFEAQGRSRSGAATRAATAVYGRGSG